MAHVVGVPKRDPCHKCQLPVFLAERLTVGKKIYHRTCLKCARCSSQLTPGSFYETEVDDEFCCETCPDEEDMAGATANIESVGDGNNGNLLRTEENSLISTPVRGGVRSSIADRLAFFEKNKEESAASPPSMADIKLLQKSVSDEEKTKSLQRMEAASTSTNASPYKMNSALSSFLNDTIDGEAADEESETASSSETKTETQMESSDSEEELEQQQPPTLPASLPPAETAKQSSPKSSPSPSKRYTATAQMLLNTQDREENHNEESKNKMQNITTLAMQKDNSNNNNNNNNDNNKAEDKTPQTLLDFRPSNYNDCITKDKTTATQPSKNAPEDNEETVQLRPKSMQKSTVQIQLESEDAATTERLSVVRARLQQFEVIANKDKLNEKPDDNENEEKEEEVKEQHKNAKEKSNQQAEITVELNVNETTNEINIEMEKPKSRLENMENIEDHQENEEKTNKQVPLLEAMEVDNYENDINEIASSDENPKVETETVKEVPLELSPIVSKSENENESNNEQMEDAELKIPDVEKSETAMSNAEAEKTVTPQPALRSTKNTTITTDTTDITSSTTNLEQYPEDLNPFKSDDDDDAENEKENLNQSIDKKYTTPTATPLKAQNLNPFDSSDDEVELEKSHNSSKVSTPSSGSKIPPPRPPPPRISRNPFGDDEVILESDTFNRRSSLNSSLGKVRTPVPTPRGNLSQNPTPEPTPRLSTKTPQLQSPYTPNNSLQNSSEYYGSINSLSASSLQRNCDVRGSNNSLTSSAGGTIRSRKNRKAPAPPPPTVKELFPSTETLGSSKGSTPSSSTVGSPKLGRKKRLAPAPPKPPRINVELDVEQQQMMTASKNLHSYPLQSELDSKLSDEEKALLEGKEVEMETSHRSRPNSRRLIPLDPSLLEEHAAGKSDDLKHLEQQHNPEAAEELNVVYRRILIPPNIVTPTHESNPLLDELNSSVHDRQLEKMKDNKEAQNRNRQSQVSASSGAEDSDPSTLYNKSSHGKWKRRKGPAPALPIPPRKILQMLPLQEIRHELDIIEVQQQGLEKQGVILEKMIRDRCEGQNGEPLSHKGTDGENKTENVQNSKEVEDLILQLFELVNEKNELFRRQAELMYLRRQHRLEQEQADLEYEIRVLMAQPERNKTDSDKSREEALIARLVEVVQLRNEVVECLEMDRLREAEEDLSIKQRLEMHSNQRESEDEGRKSAYKLSKKEKKKQKESKKNSKSKQKDVDKDADESELNADKLKLKKKKKKFLFLNAS